MTLRWIDGKIIMLRSDKEPFVPDKRGLVFRIKEVNHTEPPKYIKHGGKRKGRGNKSGLQ